MFYPYEGYRSVTPLDAARVNRTIYEVKQNKIPGYQVDGSFLDARDASVRAAALLHYAYRPYLTSKWFLYQLCAVQHV